MAITGYHMSAELVPCWWQPLLAQDYAISCHSDHAPECDIQPGDPSRFVADGVSELWAAISEQPPRSHGLDYRIALYPIRGTSHSRPLHRAIKYVLLASGAKWHAGTREDDIVLVFPPGSSFASMERLLQEQRDLALLKPDSGKIQRPLHRALQVRRPNERWAGVHLNLGVGIDPPSGQIIPYAAIHWGRSLRDVRGTLAAQLANDLAGAFLAAGSVRINPVAPRAVPAKT